MKRISIVVLLIMLWTHTAFAQDEQSDSIKIENGFKYSGYFDSYYFANLNKPASRNNLGNSGISRGFDRYPGQFQMGMFLNRMNYKYNSVEVVGEIGFGPNVEYGSYGSDFRYKWGTVIANSTYTALMIKQAYINIAASKKLTFTIGQFGTHIGYELIDAPLNFHYSINNTFNAGIPFYHLGIKANYTFNDKVSMMTGVVNGTDNINDNDRGKSFIGQLFIKPNDKLAIYFNTIQGNEANTRATGKDTTSYFGVLDFITTYQASDKFYIAFWAMHGTLKGEFQGTAFTNKALHWWGLNLYPNYKFSDLFSLGLRVEHFNNREGVRALLTDGRGTSAETYTLTGIFSLADSRLQIKPEIRLDQFKKEAGSIQQFSDSKGNFTKSSQMTVGVAAIFKF